MSQPETIAVAMVPSQAPRRSKWCAGAVILCLLAIGGQEALAKKVDPLAQAKAALQAAQTVYLVNGSDDAGLSNGLSIFAAFSQSMSAWGRYRLMPTTTGADILLVFNDMDLCSVTVLDPKTLLSDGKISGFAGYFSQIEQAFGNHNAQVKQIATTMKLLKLAAGASTAQPASNQPALAVDGANGSAAGLAALPAGVISPQEASSRILAAKTIMIVGIDDDAWEPTFAAVSFKQFQTDLAAWKHYQVVTSLEQADLVFRLGGYDDRGEHMGELIVYDAGTLRFLLHWSTQDTSGDDMSVLVNDLSQYVTSPPSK
jgi:hypothetical protein